MNVVDDDEEVEEEGKEEGRRRRGRKRPMSRAHRRPESTKKGPLERGKNWRRRRRRVAD
jgi:hypothetical protein